MSTFLAHLLADKELEKNRNKSASLPYNFYNETHTILAISLVVDVLLLS